MTNDDRPDLQALQRTVGRARLFAHNWPDDRSGTIFLQSLQGNASIGPANWSRPMFLKAAQELIGTQGGWLRLPTLNHKHRGSSLFWPRESR
jgi:hypothetical protein